MCVLDLPWQNHPSRRNTSLPPVVYRQRDSCTVLSSYVQFLTPSVTFTAFAPGQYPLVTKYSSCLYVRAGQPFVAASSVAVYCKQIMC